MKSQPTTPYFLFDRSKHFIDLCDTTEIGKRVSRLTLITEWDSHCIAYDSTGIAWGFRFERQKAKYSWFDRLSAEIYNPAQETSVVWFQLHDYPVTEIQDAYLDALTHDDDILTQFVEADELRQRIQRSASFQDLIETWRWMQTDFAWQSVHGERIS